MTDRDELLRQIGERVVERCDEDGKTPVTVPGHSLSAMMCPACGSYAVHADDCPVTRYLEATDGHG